jgi:hypothetical protein
MSAEDVSVASVAVRARRLSALSRAKRQDDKEVQELGQLQTSLNRLHAELVELSRVVDTHRKLEASGLPVAALPDLSGAALRLKDQIDSVGRPTAQFLTARTKNVTEARAATEESDIAIWRQWATEQVEALPVAVLPRLPALARSRAESRIASLKKLANEKPSVASIAQFQTSLGIMDEELASVEEASVDAVLRRFTNGRIRLADLSEAELQTLQLDESLADQLYLHISS